MYHGRLKDSIGDLTRSRCEIFNQFPYVLITCLDSKKDMINSKTGRKIVEMEESCGFLGRSLVVSDAKILDIAKNYNLFYGFDEIWLYETYPVLDKPEEISLVATLDLSKDAPSQELLEWFYESACVLGLGDGIGMNYLTTSKEIVEFLNVRQQEFEEGNGKN
jgi:hypothetical protein